jgi:hypothetical protein
MIPRLPLQRGVAIVRADMRGLLVAGAVALIAWMLFWGSEHAKASHELLMEYGFIAREFEPVPYIAELGPEGNEEFAKQEVASRRGMAASARASLKDGYARVNHADFMLTIVSGWASAVLALITLGLFVSRYRIRLDRRSGQAHAVSDA